MCVYIYIHIYIHTHVRLGDENDRVYVSAENGRMYASM